MVENYISATKLGEIAGWSVVAGCMTSAWVLMVMDPDAWRCAVLLATTACASSAVAATLTIRRFACRTASLIRRAAGLDGAPGTEVTRLR